MLNYLLFLSMVMNMHIFYEYIWKPVYWTTEQCELCLTVPVHDTHATFALSWWHGSVFKMSVFGWWIFRDLRLTYG